MTARNKDTFRRYEMIEHVLHDLPLNDMLAMVSLFRSVISRLNTRMNNGWAKLREEISAQADLLECLTEHVYVFDNNLFTKG